MLELSYSIKPDQHGVFDGRELARLLIADAFKLLAPYTDHCPACTDDLFTIIANEAISEIHTGGLEGIVLDTMSEPEAKKAARIAHVEATREATRAMLSPDHEH